MDRAEGAHFYAHWTVPFLLFLMGIWLSVSVYNSTTNYCVSIDVGGWTAYKHGPAGTINVKATTSFSSSTCS